MKRTQEEKCNKDDENKWEEKKMGTEEVKKTGCENSKH